MSHCQTCGACCASFRVDFSVTELQENGGAVPDGLADVINDHTARLRGTDYASPRCAALSGKIGERAHCNIYEWRPGPCREFREGDDACERARARHGLSPLPDTRQAATR